MKKFTGTLIMELSEETVQSHKAQHRSSCPEVSCEKNVLSKFSRFTGAHLQRRPFLIKLLTNSGVFFWTLWNFSEQVSIERNLWLGIICLSILYVVCHLHFFIQRRKEFISTEFTLNNWLINECSSKFISSSL